MRTFYAIGLMSGTSVDGVDAALVEIVSKGSFPELRLKAFKMLPYPLKIRQAILAASGHAPIDVGDLCTLNVEVGKVFSQAARAVAAEARVSMKRIDVIGSHGQTIRHLPPQGKKEGATLQIGEPTVIAHQTGVTTISHFRGADMAAGGQGAPLLPYFHYCLFRSCGYDIGIQNIGGMGNLTVIPRNASLSQVSAFDTGPGNVLIDAAVYLLSKGRKQMDKGGEIAAKGKVNKKLLSQLLKHPFLKKRPPKSTGREVFGCSDASRIVKKTKHLKKADVIATLTAFTAHSIAHSIEKFVLPRTSLKELILGGGGAKNKTLFYATQKLLPSIQLKRFEDFHLNSDAIEAMGFALLAYESINLHPANLRQVTGAKSYKVLGSITPGNNLRKLLLK